MALLCIGCGYSNFRFSRLRLWDLGMLLTLRYPVRCHGCLERYYVNIVAAWELHQEHMRKHAERLRRRLSAESPTRG